MSHLQPMPIKSVSLDLENRYEHFLKLSDDSSMLPKLETTALKSFLILLSRFYLRQHFSLLDFYTETVFHSFSFLPAL